MRRENSSPFSSLFAFYPTRDLNIQVKEQAEIAHGEYVSGDYFHGLEVLPAAGRLISPDDDRAGAAVVAVASFGFCQRHFGEPTNRPGKQFLSTMCRWSW